LAQDSVLVWLDNNSSETCVEMSFLQFFALAAALYHVGATFCADWIHTIGYTCSDGSEVGDNGCCDDGTCPEGCSSSSWGAGSCTCNGCPLEVDTSLAATSTDEARWLSAHNYFRCRHGQTLLSWSSTQAALAQAYADTCVFAHSDGSQRDSAGENLASGYTTIEGATEAWYDEIQFYSAGDTFASNTGHYTAMIWESTGVLGCGTCSASSIDVCQYNDDAPNLVGSFTANVPQDSAPTETEDTCCAQIFGTTTPTIPTAAPTSATATAADLASAGLGTRLVVGAPSFFSFLYASFGVL